MKHSSTLIVIAMSLMCTMPANAQEKITPSATTVQTLDQGSVYTFDGYEDYYVNPSFFYKLPDGKYGFKAVSGNYLIEAKDNGYKYLQVRSCNTDGSLASLQPDGTGAIYMIGNGIGLPNVTENQVGWTPENGISMAQTSPKHYELTGVVGKEFGQTIDFQFYGDNTWNHKLCGSEGQESHISSCSDLISIGLGNDVDGHDDGSLYYKEGALQTGDTLTISLDCTGGRGNVILTTDLKPCSYSTITPSPTTVQWLKQGNDYVFDGISDDYYVNPSFFSKTTDGKYRFKAVSGSYLIEAKNNGYKYLQVRSCNTDGSLASLQTDGTGAIYMIGNGIGLPNATENLAGWIPENGISMAQISPKHYELTGVIGKEFSQNIEFQFYGQAQWYPKLCGSEGQDYHVTSKSDLIGIVLGKDVDGHDDGTLYYKNGANVQAGDSLTISLDCSNGVANVVLTTTVGNKLTGIRTLSVVKAATDAWYSIDGKRLPAEPQSHGLYIHNGKKIMK